jgi:hypothetical protein
MTCTFAWKTQRAPHAESSPDLFVGVNLAPMGPNTLLACVAKGAEVDWIAL